MQPVFGVDPDVHRMAIADAIHGQVQRVQTITRSNTRGRIDPAYDSTLTAFMRHVQEVGGVIYLEGIFLAGRGNGSVKGFASMSELQGELKRAARMNSVPLIVVPPSTWHASILKITRGRDELQAASNARAAALMGRDVTDHEADACMIALYGMAEQAEAMAVPA